MKKSPRRPCPSPCSPSPLPVLAQMPPMPPPGPEHEMLKKDVGTWDATVEMFMAPGAPPAVSKGTETVTMMGGFWQLTEFKSEMMGQPFEGRGAMGYDPAKKKFVGTWVDTMAPAYYTVEGTYDAATKTLTAIDGRPRPDRRRHEDEGDDGVEGRRHPRLHDVRPRRQGARHADHLQAEEVMPSRALFPAGARGIAGPSRLPTPRAPRRAR